VQKFFAPQTAIFISQLNKHYSIVIATLALKKKHDLLRQTYDELEEEKKKEKCDRC
jgi:hypothetical protein